MSDRDLIERAQAFLRESGQEQYQVERLAGELFDALELSLKRQAVAVEALKWYANVFGADERAGIARKALSEIEEKT